MFFTSTTLAKENALLVEELEVCPLDPDSDDISPKCTILNSTMIMKEANYMCGPFVNETSVWNMVTEDVVEASMLSQIIYQIGVNVLIVWFIAMYFYLKFRFTESTLGVNISSMQERNIVFESLNAVNDNKIRKLNKEIKRLNSQIEVLKD